MMSEEVLDSSSLNKNYRVLKETADWLSKQEEPDIDQLVPKVERAMQAYRICKDRLDKVKETLGQYLQGDTPQAADGRPEAEANGLARTNRISSPGRDGDGNGSPF
jgi:exodeoxyribonuclease VII small subunit